MKFKEYQKLNNLEQWTIPQAAKLIKKSVRHTRLLCEQGKIKGYKFGKVWIVTDLGEYLRK